MSSRGGSSTSTDTNAEDLYRILGIPPGSSTAAIRKAYTALALRFHPDKATGDLERFRRAHEAYSILSDPRKRALYSKYGPASLQMLGTGDDVLQEGGGMPSVEVGSETQFGGGGGFAGLLEHFFGTFSGSAATGQTQEPGAGGTLFHDQSTLSEQREQLERQARAQKPPDLRIGVHVTLQDMITGGIVTVRYQKRTVCRDCDGCGAQGGPSQLQYCKSCKGVGRKILQRTLTGSFVQRYVVLCPKCQGRGHLIPQVCSQCQNVNPQQVWQQLPDVVIPPGSRHAQELVLPRHGDQLVPGGMIGDLVVVLLQVPDRRYARVAHAPGDLVVMHEISLPELFDGVLLTLTDHPDSSQGSITAYCAEMVRPGEVRWIPGRGACEGGDLAVLFIVCFPEHLDPYVKHYMLRLLEPHRDSHPPPCLHQPKERPAGAADLELRSSTLHPLPVDLLPCCGDGGGSLVQSHATHPPVDALSLTEEEWCGLQQQGQQQLVAMHPPQGSEGPSTVGRGIKLPTCSVQ